MAYVIQSLNNKSIVSRYETPFEMITQYFTPTILTKYQSYMLKDARETKRVFEACHNRIRQIFKYDPVVDLNDGKVKYRSGIQALYYGAKAKNLKITTTGMGANASIESALTGSSTSDDIDAIVHSISMNAPSYDDKTIDYIKDQSKFPRDSTIKVLAALHDLQYHDIVREILESIFKRIEDLKETEICTDKFYGLIQTRIISSKHNNDVTRIKDLCDKLLTDIFKTKFSKPGDYTQYMNTTRAKWRSAVILGIAHNIQKFKCK